MALALFVVAFGTNVFTPLLVLYRRDLDLTATSVTAIFAVYAAGLLPAMLVAGSASDRVGRRRIVVPFTALAGVVSLLFVPAADTVALLYVARFLQGLVAGVVLSVATAWVADLSGDRDAAARRTAVATTAGFSLGPITSGVLAQLAPLPTTLPFLVHAGLVATGLALVWTVRDVVPERTAGPLVDLRLPPGTRGRFWGLLVPTSLGVFTFPATAATVLPLLLPAGDAQVAQAGFVAGLPLAAATLIAPAGRRLRTLAGPVGAVSGAVGLVLTALGGAGSVPVLLVGAVLLGAGSGLCLTAGLTLAQLLATESTRGALSAAFYAWAYTGFVVPLLITAAAAGGALAVPLAVVAAVFTVIAVVLAVGVRRVSRAGRSPARR